MPKEIKVSWGKKLSEEEMIHLIRNEFDGRSYGNVMSQVSVIQRCSEIAEEEGGITTARVREEMKKSLMRRKVVHRLMSLFERVYISDTYHSKCPVCKHIQEEELLTMFDNEFCECEACGFQIVFDELNAIYHASLDQFEWKLNPNELLNMDIVQNVERHQNEVVLCHYHLLSGDASVRKTFEEKLKALMQEQLQGFYYNEKLEL